MSALSCGTCRHADVAVDGDEMAMTCRRYPPQMVAVQVGDVDARWGDGAQGWPSVEADDWCGEWSVTR